jgi:hypothetical protein
MISVFVNFHSVRDHISPAHVRRTRVREHGSHKGRAPVHVYITTGLHIDYSHMPAMGHSLCLSSLTREGWSGTSAKRH